MANKLLITLPCNIWELKEKLDKFDRCDVVISQYDGEGDSLYVVPVMDDLKNPDPVQQTNEFVQKLEAANKATEESQMFFK